MKGFNQMPPKLPPSPKIPGFPFAGPGEEEFSLTGPYLLKKLMAVPESDASEKWRKKVFIRPFRSSS